MGARGLGADETVEARRQDFQLDFAISWGWKSSGVGVVGGCVSPFADGDGFHVGRELVVMASMDVGVSCFFKVVRWSDCIATGICSTPFMK